MTDTPHTALKPRDPLLLAAQILLWFFIGVMSFALFFVTLGIPMAAIFQERILIEATAEGIKAGPELVGAILVLLASVAAMLACAIYFLVLLLRIVRSVKQGDPFIADNAQRLSRMGWVALSAQVAMIPVGAMALWIEEVAGDATKISSDGEMGVSGEGLLLVLILFILARVFRKGTEMRAELEGTV